MRRLFLPLGLLVGFLLPPAPAAAQVRIEVGKEAPDFELSDATGRAYKLSSYRGRNAVVLEFFRSGDW